MNRADDAMPASDDYATLAPKKRGRPETKRPSRTEATKSGPRGDQLFKGDNGSNNASDTAQAELIRQGDGIVDEPFSRYRSSRHRDYRFEPDGHHLCGLCNSLRFVRENSCRSAQIMRGHCDPLAERAERKRMRSSFRLRPKPMRLKQWPERLLILAHADEMY